MVHRSNMGLVFLLSHCTGFKFYISIYNVLFFFLSRPCNVTAGSVYIQLRIVTMFVNVNQYSQCNLYTLLLPLSRYRFAHASSDGSIIIATIPKVKYNILMVANNDVQKIPPTQNFRNIFFL